MSFNAPTPNLADWPELEEILFRLEGLSDAMMAANGGPSVVTEKGFAFFADRLHDEIGALKAELSVKTQKPSIKAVA